MKKNTNNPNDISELSGPIVLEKQSPAQTEHLCGVALGAILYGSSYLARYQQYLNVIQELKESGLFSSAELDEVNIWVRKTYLGS